MDSKTLKTIMVIKGAHSEIQHPMRRVVSKSGPDFMLLGDLAQYLEHEMIKCFILTTTQVVSRQNNDGIM